MLAVLSASAVAQDNPLLTTPNTPFQTPPFGLIENEHFLPAVEEAIRQHQAEIDAIINNPDLPTFENTLAAMDTSGQLMNRVIYVFYSLLGTVSSPELQELATQISPLLSAHYDNIRLNETLFDRVKAVYDQRDALGLSAEQLYVLENDYLQFVRRGALLTDDQKARLRELNREHSLLTLKFDENLLAETNASYVVIENEAGLAGMPEAVVAMGKQTAASMNMPDKWVFTTQRSSFTPFMKYADARDKRQELFTAYSMRGDRDNEFDNKATLQKIFTVREERARLFGHSTPAAFYMERRMAGTPEAVDSFLWRLWKPALGRAAVELSEMQAIMDSAQPGSKIEPWDWWYYAEKLRKTKYELDDEELRPYFELNKVEKGVFILAEKLFGLKFVQRDDIPIYHPTLRVFEVRESNDSLLGILYMDYFFRDSKGDGAWAGGFRDAFMRDGKRVLPLVTITCNFSEPTSDMPSLLCFDEVRTLFHEFGHALTGLLYAGTYSSGFAPLDATELPSQIMEHWALEPAMLELYATHYRTGEIIPASLVERIKKSRLFNKGFEAVEYLAACFLDMAWHGLEDASDFGINDFEAQILADIGLIPEIYPRYRTTYFSHIHGGYRAGYYAYYWSGVLDSDAFAAFKETSLFDRETAALFRENILERLGTEDAMTLYKRFRGREPRIEPFLERTGLQ
ncbi:MAG: M3 family metallopeptidase [Candidatus Zixiibacteriota bacterium]|nr:MAG: M3 family metallopeptidase [candidate division Zixibacteria bacterium]